MWLVSLRNRLLYLSSIWQLARLVRKIGHQEDICHDKIELCAQPRHTILDSRLTQLRGGYVIIYKTTWESSLWVLITFTPQLRSWNLKWDNLHDSQSILKWDTYRSDPMAEIYHDGVQSAHSRAAYLRRMGCLVYASMWTMGCDAAKIIRHNLAHIVPWNILCGCIPSHAVV